MSKILQKIAVILEKRWTNKEFEKIQQFEIGWYESQTDVFYLEYFAGGLPHPKVNKKL